MKAVANGEATPEPITRTEYFLKKIADNAKGGGGVTSWNDLTDKPFGSEVTEGVITFDGDYSKHEHISVGDGFYVKMSDNILGVQDFAGATVTLLKRGVIEEVTFHEDDVRVNVNPEDETQRMTMVFYTVFEESLVVVSVENMESLSGLPNGTYFGWLDENTYVKSISCLTGEVETIKPLDEKYLPGPKLLGEIVLTNENCTQIDNHSLRFNDDLREQVASLLETASNLKGRLFSVEVTISDTESQFAAEYSDEPTGRWLSAVYLGLLNGDSGEMTMQACTLGEYRFALTYQDALAGVLGGYPMTIKVYAT